MVELQRFTFSMDRKSKTLLHMFRCGSVCGFPKENKSRCIERKANYGVRRRQIIQAGLHLAIKQMFTENPVCVRY